MKQLFKALPLCEFLSFFFNFTLSRRERAEILHSDTYAEAIPFLLTFTVAYVCLRLNVAIRQLFKAFHLKALPLCGFNIFFFVLLGHLLFCFGRCFAVSPTISFWREHLFLAFDPPTTLATTITTAATTSDITTKKNIFRVSQATLFGIKIIDVRLNNRKLILMK